MSSILNFLTVIFTIQEMKKQAKPELFLDHYLSTLGLWRKPIARDGFCLFRAVSEQLFKTQAYFRHLYEACRVFFTLLGKTPELEWNENEVMQILSRMYRRDFLVYEIVGHPPYPATCNSYDKKIILCRIDENHLDSVYPGNFVQSAAICQSIIYEVLYKGVFKLDSELTEAVTLIRDQNKKKFGIGVDDSPAAKCGNWHTSPRDRYLRRATPPVPYRIAKALDPNIYRNVELDIWEEEKRELLKETALYKERFAPGDKCQVLLEGEHYHGHIQELRPDDDAVIVFIEELGEKKTVAYTCLKSPPRHSAHSGCMVHRYYRRKQDMPVSSQSSPPSYQGNCSTPPSSNQGQIYVPGMHYTPNGMLTSVTNSIDNGSSNTVQTNTQQNMRNNLHTLNQPQNQIVQTCSPQAQVPCQVVPSPYSVYPPAVPQAAAPQTYSCVCIPYLDTIAVNQVNMNCLPSQDMTGKDLPEVHSLRFFFNLGIEHYRMLCQGGSSWQPIDMTTMMPAPSSADQINGNNCGMGAPACTTAYPPPPCPVYYAGPPGMYGVPQHCLPGPTGMPAPVAYTNQSHGTPVYSMPPQIAQIPVLQSAQ